MPEDQNIETVSSQQLKEAVESYITWASDWDGALPADVFFGAWADMKAEKRPLEIRARVAETGLEFSAPADSPLRAVHNRILLEDGRELVVHLEAA